MNTTIGMLAAAKKLTSAVDGFKLTPGEHTVDEQFLIHVKGTVTKGKDSEYVPTVSVPYKLALALLVQKCGIVGEAAVKALTEAMKEAIDLSNEKTAEEAIAERCKNLEAAEAKVQKMLGALPKAVRSGQTRMGKVELRIQPVVPELV